MICALREFRPRHPRGNAAARLHCIRESNVCVGADRLCENARPANSRRQASARQPRFSSAVIASPRPRPCAPACMNPAIICEISSRKEFAEGKRCCVRYDVPLQQPRAAGHCAPTLVRGLHSPLYICQRRAAIAPCVPPYALGDSCATDVH